MSLFFKPKSAAAKMPLNVPLLSGDEISSLAIQALQIQQTTHSSHQQISRETGWLPTKALGSGMDYAESREYQQGDDPRYINWRLSARSTETFVKTYHIEARPSLCIVLDQRRSMVFGTRTRLKISQALRMTTLLAHVAQQKQIDLNIVIIDDRNAHWLGNQTLEGLLDIYNHSPSVIPEDTSTVTIPLQAISELLQQHLSIGSLVYIISDFYDFDVSNTKILTELFSQYFIQILHIIDIAEKKLPKSGGVCLKDPLNDSSLNVDSNDPNIHAMLTHTLNDHLQSIQQTFNKSAVSYTEVLTDEDTLYPFIQLPLGV